MQEAVFTACNDADAVIMAAAVSDFRPAEAAVQKIKRGDSGLSLDLVKIADILAAVPANVVKVGFAAETQDLLENAQKKLLDKGLDLNVVNDVSASDAGFAVDTNRVTILDCDGGREDVPLMGKYEVAQHILNRGVPILAQGQERSSS